MTVSYSVHCSGVIRWSAYSSHLSAPLPAQTVCETCKRMF